MFSMQAFQLDSDWGKNMYTMFDNWNGDSSFDKIFKTGDFHIAMDNRSDMGERRDSRHGPPYSQPITEAGLNNHNGVSETMQGVVMTEERWNTPQTCIPPPQPAPIQHQLRRQSHRQISTRDYQRTLLPEPTLYERFQGNSQESHLGIRHDFDQDIQQPNPAAARLQLRRDRRRVRAAAPVHRPEETNIPDPPPAYSFFDPTRPPHLGAPRQPFTPPDPHPHRRFRLRREHGSTNNSQGSGELGAALERMNGYIRELPKTVREVPAKLRTRRARQKLAWLKKHNFLSEQERYLTEDLMG